MKQRVPAALPHTLRKASGFPSTLSNSLAAMPPRHSLTTLFDTYGKPEAFRKECGKAEGPFVQCCLNLCQFLRGHRDAEVAQRFLRRGRVAQNVIAIEEHP